MTLSTHVLDTSIGRPAKGMKVRLDYLRPGDSWTELGTFTTDADGRVQALIAAGRASGPGTYRLTFSVAAYFNALSIGTFYTDVAIEFVVRDDTHHHVPLLVSPYSYSTYRGS
jgi:5-hydroxyisourate hydrolase